jgi:hypothetical protein
MICHVCPGCEEMLFSPLRLAGRAVRCPRCRFEAEVPPDLERAASRFPRVVCPRPLRSSHPFLLMLWLIVAGALACSVMWAAWVWQRAHAPVQGPLEWTLTAQDGRTQLKVPAGWGQRHSGGPERGVLLASDRLDESCVKVLTEPKADHGWSMTLEQYGRLALEQLDEHLLHFELLCGPTPLVIGGLRALRHEVRGRTKRAGGMVVFLHTVVEGRAHFHQVIGLSLVSRIDRDRRQLEAIVGSFRERR